MDRALQRAALCLAVVAATLALAGCDRAVSSSAATAALPGVPHTAEAEFHTLVAACTQSLARRAPTVRADPEGGWAQTGYSPAQVRHEVHRTGSGVTPSVGKIVIKDNVAQAHASTEAAAQAITLTPAHLLSHRTHTLVYSHDGKRWRWENGQQLTKRPGHNDSTVALTLADVSATGPKGFAKCLPQ